MAVAHPQVSPQDFAALMASPEWDRRVEHLAGEIVVNPSPSPRHPVPDLVVEIASPRTVSNDRGLKRDAYLRAGVREQWLLDPSDRTAIVIDADGTQRALASGERLVSAILRGFSVPVDRLFGDA